MSLIGTVLVEHSMLLLLTSLTIERQKNSVATAACYCFNAQPKAAIEAAISIGVAMVAGSGSSMGLKWELCLASCVAPSSNTSALLSFKKLTIEGQKTSHYCCFSHTTVFKLN